MSSFAHRTGLTSERAPRRYLWTDAFAVLNYLELARLTGLAQHRELALRLVEQVHRVLGHHRADDSRRGWLSGLDEEYGWTHPTRGGLRIGKPQPERGPGSSVDRLSDERAEWDRDGQYFHYLTKWMQALAQVSRVTGDPSHLRHAVELAEAAHAGFVRAVPGGSPRLAWKMSIDLERPLVPAMGLHDPLDGWLTFAGLAAQSARVGGEPVLGPQIVELRALVVGLERVTDDPLGVGGLLWDALRLGRLVAAGRSPEVDVLGVLLHSAAAGTLAFSRGGGLAQPAARRLAFRELGLALGLRAVPLLEDLGEHGLEPPLDPGDARPELSAGDLATLRQCAPVGEFIEQCWLDPRNRELACWRDHEDINAVMLATSQIPGGALGA